MSTATITQLGDFLASQITLIGGSTLTAASFNNLIDPTQSANNQANTASTLLGVGTMLTAIASPLANISPALCLPVAISGMAVTALSLANNLNQIAASVQEGKQPQLSTVTSAFADVSALTGSTAILYATYASAGTLAVDIAILSAMGPVLAGAAVGLGIATLMMSPEDLASIPDVIYEGFKHFQEITEVLNPFWLNSLGHLIGQNLPLPDDIFDFFTRAQNWRPYVPVDPLALDLDNDGIETTTINGWNGVLFDHNNDGVKTATGWLKGDDGFLVLDRNGNGTIDNGGELFGDNTKLGNGVNATDGFAALADVDTNYDHIIDVNDGVFPLLKVWQDLNQDGISQANELKTLTELGITSLTTESVIFYKNRLINFTSLV